MADDGVPDGKAESPTLRGFAVKTPRPLAGPARPSWRRSRRDVWST